MKSLEIAQKIQYDFGQTVYSKTDSEQLERVITMIKLTPGAVMYHCCINDQGAWYYDFELTPELDTVKKTK